MAMLLLVGMLVIALNRIQGVEVGNSLTTKKTVDAFKMLTANVTAFLKDSGDVFSSLLGSFATISAIAAESTINTAKIGGSFIDQEGNGQIKLASYD